MQYPVTLTNLFAKALTILQLINIALSAAATQGIPRHKSLPVQDSHGSQQQTLQARFYAWPPTFNMSSLPVEPIGQTYTLGPSMTINGNLIVPDSLTGGNSLPLLLDTLSACTWLPTKSIHCYNGTTTSSGAKQGDDCIGVSAVAHPAASINFSTSPIGAGAQVACPHYLAGFVSGPLLCTELNVAGRTVEDAEVLFAEAFYSKYGLSLHKFAQYYGGAVGVLGLGMHDEVWDAKELVEEKQKWNGEVMAGVLRRLWIVGKNKKNSTEAVEKVWSLALPRWDGGEEANGRFVIGGLVSNGTAVTTGQEIVLPLSNGEGWVDVGLVRRMLYALPQVAFNTGSGGESGTSGEEYFFDSALPVIYASQETAEHVSSLFSPPGVFDNTTGLYMVDCNATAPKNISVVIDDGYKGSISVLIYPGDLIVFLPLDNRAGGACVSGFQVNADYPEWRRLGWPFFRNVVVTVDVDQWAVNVSARTWPKGASPPAPLSTPSTLSRISSTSATPMPTSTVIATEIKTTTTTSVATRTVGQSVLPSADSGSGVPSPSAPTSDPLNISFPNTATAIISSPAISTSFSTYPGVSNTHTEPKKEPMANSPDLGIYSPLFCFPNTSSKAGPEASASTIGPVSMHRRGEGEVQSVADEHSGMRMWEKRRAGEGSRGEMVASEVDPEGAAR